MAQLDIREKLAILADAAKYDASCASSGTSKRDSRSGTGVGSTEGMGICHAYAPDGRCISLLKILLTTSCIFDCHYCINRKSSNVRLASRPSSMSLLIAFIAPSICPTDFSGARRVSPCVVGNSTLIDTRSA